MSRIHFIVALLLSGLANEAAAGDGLKNTSSSHKAEKINAYLEKIGINSPGIQHFAATIDQRIEGDCLRLSEERFEYGRVVLFYELDPHVSTRQLQLKFQPDNSHVDYTMTTHSAMVGYNFAF